MFFICHVEIFIKILPFRTHNTDDTKNRKREREVVKCRDEKKNTAVDQDGIKFHSLSTTPQQLLSLPPEVPETIHKISHSFSS